MAHILKALVGETSTTTGTGSLTLAAALTDHRRFSAVCTTSDTTEYMIRHATDGTWEAGIGTYSAANTLTRTSVSESSNANAAVSFAAGAKNVVLTPLASRLAVNPMWERVSSATATTGTAYLTFTGLQAGYVYKFEGFGLDSEQTKFVVSHDGGTTWPVGLDGDAWAIVISTVLYDPDPLVLDVMPWTQVVLSDEAFLGIFEFSLTTPELHNPAYRGAFVSTGGVAIGGNSVESTISNVYQLLSDPINAIRFLPDIEFNAGTIVCYRRSVT